MCEQTPAEDIPLTIHADGYYSRKLFGKYLNWVFYYIQEFSSSDLNISYIPLEVIDIDNESHSWSAKTEDGKYHSLDYVFVTTGHTKPKKPVNDSVIEIRDPYPITDKLTGLNNKHTVAIKGMGLTMCDVVAELTQGRNGKFNRDNSGKLIYSPSGKEPNIIAYSRAGLPLSGRAMNQKGASVQYKAKFLTTAKVKELRNKGAIDFLQDVLPLLVSDMEYAYYEAYITDKQGTIEAKKFCNSYLFSSTEKRAELINRFVQLEDRFSWQRLITPIPMSILSSKEKYSNWLKKYLENDLFEAKRGNLSSPIKSASDVLRDLRDMIRDVVDYKGLTEESHRWVDAIFIPIMNRIAVGPPKERIEEMLALVDSGILSIDMGPSPNVALNLETAQVTIQSSVWPEYEKIADVLVHAQISMHSPKDDGTELWQQLLSKGYARLYFNGNYHPGGIDVSHNMQVINKDGATHTNMWALGVPTEGNKFYTFIVPRPGVNSTAIVDAGKAVNQLFSAIAQQQEISYAQ